MTLDLYNRRGEPIDENEYARLLTLDSDYRRVALTKITDGLEVSTVWLGLDHNWTGRGAPLIFETMVFVAREEPIKMFGGGAIDTEGTEYWRWSTELEAIEGHVRVVRDLASNLALDDVETLIHHPHLSD